MRGRSGRMRRRRQGGRRGAGWRKRRRKRGWRGRHLAHGLDLDRLDRQLRDTHLVLVDLRGAQQIVHRFARGRRVGRRMRRARRGAARVLRQPLGQLGGAASQDQSAIVVLRLARSLRCSSEPHDRIDALVALPERLGGLQGPCDVLGIRVERRAGCRPCVRIGTILPPVTCLEAGRPCRRPSPKTTLPSVSSVTGASTSAPVAKRQRSCPAGSTAHDRVVLRTEEQGARFVLERASVDAELARAGALHREVSEAALRRRPAGGARGGPARRPRRARRPRGTARACRARSRRPSRARRRARRRDRGARPRRRRYRRTRRRRRPRRERRRRPRRGRRSRATPPCGVSAYA